MVRCAIDLQNNSRAVYTAGELLKGSIKLYLDKPKKIKAFWFVVFGAAKCHWKETHNKYRKNQRTVHYEGKDVYINQKTFLFGSEGASAVEMASGTYNYEFSCQLPARLPATFRASHGSITYDVEAVLDIPWAFDKQFKLEFTVVRHDDLNNQPGLRIPIKSEEIRRSCCLFWETEPLIMTVTLPCSGFALGQAIPVSIDLVNKSNVDVNRVEIVLKRIIRFVSQRPYPKMKYEVDRIAAVNAAGVKGSNSTKIEKAILLHSILPPTNLQFCNVLQICYELKIRARVDGCNGDIKLTIPIVIGTIPISLASSAPSALPSAPEGFNQSNFNASAPIESQQDQPPSYNDIIRHDNPQLSLSDVKMNLSQPSGSSFGWVVPGAVEGAEAPSAPEKQ